MAAPLAAAIKRTEFDLVLAATDVVTLLFYLGLGAKLFG